MREVLYEIHSSTVYQIMAAVLGRTEIGLKNISTSVRIPDSPKARLMYYLNYICAVLDIDDEDGIERIRQYNNYVDLTDAETDLLLLLCSVLSPDVLLDKCIFVKEDLTGESANAFYELSAARTTLAATDNIMVGGQIRRVKKIMFFRMKWIVQFISYSP